MYQGSRASTGGVQVGREAGEGGGKAQHQHQAQPPACDPKEPGRHGHPTESRAHPGHTAGVAELRKCMGGSTVHIPQQSAGLGARPWSWDTACSAQAPGTDNSVQDTRCPSPWAGGLHADARFGHGKGVQLSSDLPESEKVRPITFPA